MHREHALTINEKSRKEENGTAEETRPVSEIVSAILECGDERVALGEITSEMKGRAHGIILVVLALPETVPMVGLSFILAIPIFVIGAHLLACGSETSLPAWVERRSIRRSHLERAYRKARPALQWLERVSRSRWHRLAGATRVHGLVCILMALLLAIPVPGINVLAAFAVAGTGVGMLQRDGRVLAFALASALLAMVGMVAVVTGVVALST